MERLGQLDALRVLGCLSVVTVHAIGAPFPADSVGLGEASFLLHYSREIFFFVSALVLVRSSHPKVGPDGRLPDEDEFRRRRLRLIGVPYLWWTTLYGAVWLYRDLGGEQAFGSLVNDLPLRWLFLVVTGSGNYHMYFLLVSIQYGLAFPLVLRLLRRTEGRHGQLLIASLALQVATLAVYHWGHLPENGWRALLGDASLPAYQFWLIAGAVAGVHVHRWHECAMRHRFWLLGAFPICAAVLTWTYFVQVESRGAVGASSPLQPIMIMWAVSVLGVLYLASVRLVRRASSPTRTLVGHGARLSFGVYLAHPLVLDVVLAVLRRLDLVAPSAWVAFVVLLLTVGVTTAGCALLQYSRFSPALIGRPRIRRSAAQVPV